jgi:hypothetical protein
MTWFGPPVDLAICQELDHVPAPIGRRCSHCREQFARGESGVIAGAPLHIECFMRVTLGSVAHQARRCACYGGGEYDPPGVSQRQAAKAAWEYFLAHDRLLRSSQESDEE